MCEGRGAGGGGQINRQTETFIKIRCFRSSLASGRSSEQFLIQLNLGGKLGAASFIAVAAMSNIT